MLETVGATIDEQIDPRLSKRIQLPKFRRAFAAIFSEELRIPEIALLSEAALAQEQHLSEEDAAWTHLQPE